MMDMLRGVGQGNLPCTEFRLRILEVVIISFILVITSSLHNNVIARIQSLILSVLNMEDTVAAKSIGPLAFFSIFLHF